MSTLKNPFYVMLKLDQFHLAPQGAPTAQSGVTSAWWTTYNKKPVGDKLKLLKQLLIPMITEMPSLNEDDETVAASRAAVAS